MLQSLIQKNVRVSDSSMAPNNFRERRDHTKSISVVPISNFIRGCMAASGSKNYAALGKLSHSAYLVGSGYSKISRLPQ